METLPVISKPKTKGLTRQINGNLSRVPSLTSDTASTDLAIMNHSSFNANSHQEIRQSPLPPAGTDDTPSPSTPLLCSHGDLPPLPPSQPLPPRTFRSSRAASARGVATAVIEEERRQSNTMMSNLAQVNISGLRAATDEKRQKSRRLLWVFLLSVCFAVMVAQMTDRVKYFLSEPVAVQVRVARNSSLTYPAITICNKVKY